MKNPTRMLALGVSIAAICGTQLALAQSAGLSVGAPRPFAAYDTDGSGSITEQEFSAVHAQQKAERAAAGAPMGGAANTPPFAVFDRNSDGKVSPTEFETVQPAPVTGGPGTMGSGPRMGLSAGGGAAGAGGVSSFTDLDENKDGGISPSEFNDARANRAVEKSQEGQPLGSLRNAPPFSALDLNGDGRIGPEEFASAQAERGQPASPPLPAPR
jgi:Ca2+-binding EF-hand superfamily protein